MMLPSILWAKKLRDHVRKVRKEKGKKKREEVDVEVIDIHQKRPLYRRQVAEFDGEIRAAWGLSGGVVWGKRKRRG